MDQYMKLQTTPTKAQQRLVVKKKKPATVIKLDETVQNTPVVNSQDKGNAK